MQFPSKISFWHYLPIVALAVPFLLAFWVRAYASAASLGAATFNYIWLQVYSYVAVRYPETGYNVHILSYDPLMIYIVNFIPKHERDYLLSLGTPFFLPSEVSFTNGTTRRDAVRTSSSAFLPEDDPVVARITARAAALQGFAPLRSLEGLQLTRYRTGQEYKPHLDHFYDEVPPHKTDRITTIFAVLEATCERCGTSFPRLAIDWSQEDRKWCRFMDCSDLDALTVRAVPGNALFWKNIDGDRLGDNRMLHAGLPLLNGVKTGLNIWTLS